MKCKGFATQPNMASFCARQFRSLYVGANSPSFCLGSKARRSTRHPGIVSCSGTPIDGLAKGVYVDCMTGM